MAGTNYYGISPGPGSAGQTYSAMTRDAWSSWVENFLPYENKLIEFATDVNAPVAAMSRASGIVNTQFDNAQRDATERMRGMGVRLDDDEQRAMSRSFGLQRSLTDVQAQNTARDVTRARQRQAMGNPSPDPTIALKGM